MLNLRTRSRVRGVIGLMAAALMLSSATAVSQAAPLPTAPVPPAKDATLKSLAITSPAKTVLSPKFAATKVKYTANVAPGVTAVKFKAVPKQKAAKVAVKAPKPLKPGPNKITVTVTAPDKKTKKVYTVTVTVLKPATVVPDPAGATIVPGGFQVRVTVVNATIVPVVTVTSTDPKCTAVAPYALVSAPDGNNVVVVEVRAIVKGCSARLNLTVKPNRGYAAVTVTPVTATPNRDKVAFVQKPVVRTADGFTMDFTVLHGSATCASGSDDNPLGTSVSNTATQLTVSGLEPNASATVRCTFTADADTDGLDPVTVTGSALSQALMLAADSVSQQTGFTAKITVAGCVPSAVISDGPDTAVAAVTGPVSGSYTLTVTGLNESEAATATVSCTGIAGSFSDAESLDVPGQAISATELGLKTAPRVANVPADIEDGANESDLPDVVPGQQPSLLYATTPEWAPWDTSGKNVFKWQVSATDRDDDGIACNDPRTSVAWVDLAGTNAIDPAYPQLLNVGDLLATKSQYLGRCVRAAVTGTYGKRVRVATATGVALASHQPPTECSERPIVTSSSEADYAVRGDVLTTTEGVCLRAVGLAMSYRWQVSAVTSPTSDDDWTTVTGAGSSVTVVSSMLGRWIRSLVTYTADDGSTVLSSQTFAIAGTLRPVSSSIPVISCASEECIGLTQAKLTLVDLGDWTRAAGSVLGISWQFSADGGATWEAQSVLDENGDELTASTMFVALQAGVYRAVVTFSSQTGAFEDVSATSNEVSWVPTAE